MPDKVVLAFCIPVRKERELKSLCQSEKILYKTVTAAGYQKTLGSIAGIKGIPVLPPKPTEGSVPSEEMLVFSGFTQEELFSFTGKMKEEKIGTVALKAMITMTNIFWTPKMLFEEISREHEKMKKWEKKEQL